jgi:hypothetical protein
VFALGVELDQGLGGVAAHRIAGARSPDGLAVELEVAVARRRSIRVQVSVDGSLRSGSHLRAAVLVEGREAHSTTIDPAQIRCRKNRPQRRRVVYYRITSPVLPLTNTRFFSVLLDPEENLPAIRTLSP